MVIVSSFGYLVMGSLCDKLNIDTYLYKHNYSKYQHNFLSVNLRKKISVFASPGSIFV